MYLICAYCNHYSVMKNNKSNKIIGQYSYLLMNDNQACEAEIELA